MINKEGVTPNRESQSKHKEDRNTNREGKTVTFTLTTPLTQEEEAREKAIIEAKLAKDEARAQAAAAKAKQEALSLNAALFRALNAEDFAGLSHTPRRRAREAALLMLFQVEVGGSGWDMAAGILEMAEIKGSNAAFALELAQTAYSRRLESDALLAAYAQEWDVARFSPVDRAVLHLAVPELLAAAADGSIVINEAIELGKKFGSEESGPFINGILDHILKDRQAPESPETGLG